MPANSVRTQTAFKSVCVRELNQHTYVNDFRTVYINLQGLNINPVENMLSNTQAMDFRSSAC